jgi:tetratricopeptide (TPR) repeat protein
VSKQNRSGQKTAIEKPLGNSTHRSADRRRGHTAAEKATGRSRSAVPLPLIGAVVALVLAAAALGWHSLRSHAHPAVRMSTPDAREAELQHAVRTRPADASAREALAALYIGRRQPFEALWELAVVGASSPQSGAQVAAALRQAGLPDAALAWLDEARRAQPAAGDLTLAAAQTCLEVVAPEAVTALVYANAPLSSSLEGLLARARAELVRGDLPAARAAARRCRQRAGSEIPAELRLALGRLALACGDDVAARVDLATVARARPEAEEAQYFAGLAHTFSGTPGDRQAAIEFFKQATRADPHRARAGVELARLLYEKTGHLDRAAEVYRQALSIEPQSLTAEAGLARARTALGQTAEAVYHQARVRELEDRPEDALVLYRRWGELRPERWDSVLRVAECFMDRQKYVDAAREVRRGLERFPNNPELYGHLTQLLIRTSDRPEAQRLCERWTTLDSTSGRPEWVRGQLASQALRSDEASGWFEAAVRKTPDLSVFHADLGVELARQPTPERLRRARTELQQATALSPEVGLFHAQLGTVLQQLGDREDARREFLRALDHDPTERLEAYRGLMALARQMGQPGGAAFFVRLEREARDWLRDATAARRAVWDRPRDASARLALARLLLRRGRIAEARNHLAVAAGQPDGAAARPILGRVERLLKVQ